MKKTPKLLCTYLGNTNAFNIIAFSSDSFPSLWGKKNIEWWEDHKILLKIK